MQFIFYFVQAKLVIRFSYLVVSVAPRATQIVRRYTLLLQIFAVCRNFLFGVVVLYFASKIYRFDSSLSEKAIVFSLSFMNSTYSQVERE
ncbi:TPA: hypothetical protein DEG21_03355 [Patescibacteria group bacterium]|nr:hypothetical protein [Candidatus Gracilibacteria bacterium]HBY74895.1 hypothetical protein [Candidatus Gracilibacteria bacterium]